MRIGSLRVPILCFEGMGLHRVLAWCDSGHVAARRVMEKAGMTLEGEFRQNFFRDGKWRNTVYYAVLDAEYTARKNIAPPKPQRT